MEASSPSIRVYVATHKELINEQESYQVPIQVGAAFSLNNLCDVRDDVGYNISKKNQEFCELTALYWIWKNDIHDIAGLSHYRRRFNINAIDITRILKSFDLIIPKAYYFRYSLNTEYHLHHIGKDLVALFTVIHELYPDLDETAKVVFQNNKLVPYNMLIGKKEQIDSYCQWLFPILFSLEKRIDLTSRSGYQKRVFGFLAERLLSVYIQAAELKAYEVAVSIPDKSSLCKRVKFVVGQRFNKSYFKMKMRHG